jgi:hypothetical protein
LPVRRQQRRKTAARTARARIVAAEFLDQLGVLTDKATTALDVGFARGNPRRRLLVGSKGRLGVEIAIHDCLLGSETTVGARRPPWRPDFSYELDAITYRILPVLSNN